MSMTREERNEFERELKYDSETFDSMDVKTKSLNTDKPKQYRIGIDTFERAKANMSKEELIAACKFNIDKYTWRNKGQDLADAKKIKDYADLMIWAITQKEK